MNLARAERFALCDTFTQVGPAAPTLCEGWLTADLAAHLAIRDGRPDLAIGMFLPPAKGRLDRASREMALGDWSRLVHRVRSGPPKWSPVRFDKVDESANTAEFFIHHEDVLRAEDGWRARPIDATLEQALWSVLKRMGTLLVRSAPTGVVFVSDEFGRSAAKGPTELGTCVVSGRPGELALFAFGRQRVAQVEVSGDDAAVAALRGGSLGF